MSVSGLSIFDSNVGIGTSSPYAKLSVVGEIVGSYFTATSTTATSTFANGIYITNGCFRGADGNCITSGGGGTPGGSDTYVQFNNNGLFGGDSGLTFNSTTNKLIVGGDLTATGDVTLGDSNTDRVKVLGNLYQRHRAKTPSITISNFETDGDNTFTEWEATGNKTGNVYVSAMDAYSGAADSQLATDFIKSGTPNANTNQETGAKCASGSCQKVTTIAGGYADKGITTNFGASQNVTSAMAIKASVTITCDDCDATNKVYAFVNTVGGTVREYLTPERMSATASANGIDIPTTPTVYSTSFVTQGASTPVQLVVRSGSTNTGTVTFYVDNISITYDDGLTEALLRDEDTDGVTDTFETGRMYVADSATMYTYVPREGNFAYALNNNGAAAFTTTKTLSPAQDFSRHHFDFWVYVSNIAELNYINASVPTSSGIYLQFTDGAVISTAPVHIPHTENNYWHHITLSRAAFTNDTTIDWSAITSVKFGVNPSSANQTGVMFDGFQAYETFPFPMVMFKFDDCTYSDYVYAKPYLDKYGYKGFTACKTNVIDTAGGYLSSGMLKELDATGWDIGSHTHTHVKAGESAAPEEAADNQRWLYELAVSKREIEDRGITKGARFFAYPFGSETIVTPSKEPFIKQYYKMAFPGILTGSPINPLPYGDPYRFMWRSAEDLELGCGSTLIEAKGIVDDIVRYGGVYVPYFHNILLEEEVDGIYTMLDCFRQFVDYVNASGAIVVTPSDVYDNFLLGDNDKDQPELTTRDVVVCDTTDQTSCIPVNNSRTLVAGEAGLVRLNLETATANPDQTLPLCAGRPGLKFTFLVRDTDATPGCGGSACDATIIANAADSILPAVTDADGLDTAGESVTVECDGLTTWHKIHDSSS